MGDVQNHATTAINAFTRLKMTASPGDMATTALADGLTALAMGMGATAVGLDGIQRQLTEISRRQDIIDRKLE